eukprot:TRINITY_DN7520_c1_g2_i1.p1 TRINITY_DN7520_c1_g2~~TRINITY_DN7520_c1_g2_i1.p1  ORF type:complete len:274 (+),score=39.29 TRINITY_DN7520_c1_g2_i1:1083-1904(+)
MLESWGRRSESEQKLIALMRRSEHLRLPPLIFGDLNEKRVDPAFRAYLDRRYHKIVLLVDFIASTGAVGAEAVVEACELFASGSARQWLKVAGDEKAELIDACLKNRTHPERSVIAEFGSFVGYSCVRMAWKGGPETRVVSIESDAVHVLVARHIAVVARQSFAVEIVPGMAHDVSLRLIEEWGGGGVGFTFMDHRGTRFHEELAQLEKTNVLHAPGSCFLADNTLKPGAPVLLWHLLHATPSLRHATATSWSLREFVTDTCEDWMTLSYLRS